MEQILFKDARLVNRGRIFEGDLLVTEGRISDVGSSLTLPAGARLVNVSGRFLLPGVIDDQVHFREPGLTHKACIRSESRAAVAGGVTSFMEMPNTSPQTLTQELLEAKYRIAAENSPANYSFFMGASNDNLDEVLRTDPAMVCGVKVFMGSSTGNMLVNDPVVLERLFRNCPMLIATHCEDEATIRANMEIWKARYGDDIPMREHPFIRSREACQISSSMAISLAEKHDTRLHILHISTAEETRFFSNDRPLTDKKITAEACVHHLFFSAEDYERLGTLIKCNPAIKDPEDRQAIWEAVLDDRIDIIATDHAPHTLEEKQRKYAEAPAGLPLVQHPLIMMYQAVRDGRLTLPRLVEKMCHAPAECFRIRDRGYLDPGQWADIVILDPEAEWEVNRAGLLYQCGWSPLEGLKFTGRVAQTWVNGHQVWDGRNITANRTGMRLTFDA